jgi:hypothetical protein
LRGKSAMKYTGKSGSTNRFEVVLPVIRATEHPSTASEVFNDSARDAVF